MHNTKGIKLSDVYQNSITFASQVLDAFDLLKTIMGSPNEHPHKNHATSGLKLNCYQYIIHSLTGNSCSRCEAKDLWLKLLAHQTELIGLLGRDPGIVVAALDYLENFYRKSNNHYIFIEQGQLSHLVDMSLLDGLTQLYNRNTFMLLMDKEIQLAKRNNQQAALILIDLDDFKSINDNNGHQYGDSVLVDAARAIKAATRSMDVAGRYGGDEFMAFLPATNKEDAYTIAERIKEYINHNSAVDNKTTEEQSKVSLSIGVSHFPDGANNINDLIEAADKALYSAKSKGKNLVVESAPTLPSKTDE